MVSVPVFMESRTVMNKLNAKTLVTEYFDKHRIKYKFLVEEDRPAITAEPPDTIYLCAEEVPHVIGNRLETCLRFKEDHLYCQTYYCIPIVRNEEECVRAARMINYLNKNLNYDCNALYDHIFVLDEHEGDVYNALLVRYELLERYFEETMNHILNYSLQQLTDICFPLISYITGNMNYYEATAVEISYNLMGIPIPPQEQDEIESTEVDEIKAIMTNNWKNDV